MIQVTERTLTDVDSDMMGFCVYCGEESPPVEPDARRYKCELCGRRGVYGLVELVLMGQVEIIGE